MEVVDDNMYWALCPKCSNKILRIKSGEIEAVCTNPRCKRKWLITVSDDTFRYEVVKEGK